MNEEDGIPEKLAVDRGVLTATVASLLWSECDGPHVTCHHVLIVIHICSLGGAVTMGSYGTFRR